LDARFFVVVLLPAPRLRLLATVGQFHSQTPLERAKRLAISGTSSAVIHTADGQFFCGTLDKSPSKELAALKQGISCSIVTFPNALFFFSDWVSLISTSLAMKLF
jgi:hypothetical protein